MVFPGVYSLQYCILSFICKTMIKVFKLFACLKTIIMVWYGNILYITLIFFTVPLTNFTINVQGTKHNVLVFGLYRCITDTLIEISIFIHRWKQFIQILVCKCTCTFKLIILTVSIHIKHKMNGIKCFLQLKRGACHQWKHI